MFKLNPMKSIMTLLIAVLMVFSLAGFAGATALSADKTYVVYTAGEELDFPVYTNTDIYTGGLVMVNATGYAIPGSDTAGGIFVGVSTETVDNNPAASGAKTVTCMRRGLHLLALGTAISQANVGDNVFLVDDQTVDLAGNCTNDIYVGIIAKYVSSTRAYVDIVPAIQQADVATHIADTSGAHASSAISFADSGNKTAATEVDGALDEIYLDLVTAQAFIDVPLAILYESDATNMTALTGATGPSRDMANGDTDSGIVLTWAASNSDAVIFQVSLPPDLDEAAAVVIHFRADSGTTDTPTIAADTYFNEGDTKVEDTSAALGATYAENVITVAAADVPAGAQTMTVELTPGAHTTDAITISAIWIEYTRVLRTN